MASNAVFGQGTLVQRESFPLSDVWIDIAELGSITGPETDREMIDVTHQQSPNRHREYIGGLRESGSLSFDMNFNPNDATHQQFLADQQSGIIRRYKLVFPSTPPYAFRMEGIVKKMSTTEPVDGIVKAACEIFIVSSPEYTGITP